VVRRQMLAPDDEQVPKTRQSQRIGRSGAASSGTVWAGVDRAFGHAWAGRAEYELGIGFGMIFAEGFSDPRYAGVSKSIKLPKF